MSIGHLTRARSKHPTSADLLRPSRTQRERRRVLGTTLNTQISMDIVASKRMTLFRLQFIRCDSSRPWVRNSYVPCLKTTLDGEWEPIHQRLWFGAGVPGVCSLLRSADDAVVAASGFVTLGVADRGIAGGVPANSSRWP